MSAAWDFLMTIFAWIFVVAILIGMIVSIFCPPEKPEKKSSSLLVSILAVLGVAWFCSKDKKDSSQSPPPD
jgi:uncharacterized membrane protein